jgi:beta-lactam-binding protein with PASTA domain
VQSVNGESQAQATQTLDNQGFQVQVAPTDPSTCSPSQVNTVTSQDPGIGAFIPYKSEVTISICEASTEPSTTTTSTTIP